MATRTAGPDEFTVSTLRSGRCVHVAAHVASASSISLATLLSPW